MTQVIIAPDVDAWAVTTLSEALSARSESYAQDVNVSTVVPNPRLDRMVTVRLDGGTRHDGILEDPRLGVNVWATSEVECADLSRLVCALLAASADDTVTSIVQSLGPSVVEDAQPRRYAVFALTVRGDAL